METGDITETESGRCCDDWSLQPIRGRRRRREEGDGDLLIVEGEGDSAAVFYHWRELPQIPFLSRLKFCKKNNYTSFVKKKKRRFFLY